MSIHQRLCTAIAALILGGASVALAQIRSGTITGTVTDTTGAVVPAPT